MKKLSALLLALLVLASTGQIAVRHECQTGTRMIQLAFYKKSQRITLAHVVYTASVIR